MKWTLRIVGASVGVEAVKVYGSEGRWRAERSRRK